MRKEMSFWAGFEKRSEYMANTVPTNTTQPNKQPGLMSRIMQHPLASAGAALTTGLGTYAALRKPWQSTKLHRIVRYGGKTPPSKMRRWFDTMLHGADEIHYRGPNAPNPSKPLKVKGNVAVSAEEVPMLKGDRTIGDVKNPEMRKLVWDKGLEGKFFQKHAPEYGIETHILGKRHQGIRNIKALHSKMQDKPYFIKPRQGAASGVGGYSFINQDDMTKFFAKKRLAKQKMDSIRDLIQNPSKYILQPNIGIKESPITKMPSEFRIHTMGGKVVKGTGSARGMNIEDTLRVGSAEKYMQEFLDKLPARYKHRDTMFSADVALTPEGFKIIELNPGGLESGLLEPGLLYHKYKEPLSALSAAHSSQKLYRHIQGRSHPVSATVGATMGAGTAYGGTSYLKRRMEENNQPSN